MPQTFDPSSTAQFQGVQLSQNLQNRQQEAQRRYMLQHQAQQQQQQQQQMSSLAASNIAAQQRHQAGQMPGVPMQHPGMQRNMMAAQTGQNPQDYYRAFIKNVASVLAAQNRPFNPNPTAAGRPVHLQALYSIVLKHKGWRYVTQTGAWPNIAQSMGFDPRHPTVAEELRQIYEQNLSIYEAMFVQSKQQQHQSQMKAAQVPRPMGGMPPQMSPTRPGMPGAPNSGTVHPEYLQQLQRSKLAAQQQRQPSEPMQQQPQQPQLDSSIQPPQQFEHMTPVQPNASLATVNGRNTPQTELKAPRVALDPQHRRSVSRQLESTPDQVPPAPSTQPILPGQEKIQEEKAMEKFKAGLPTNLVEGKMTYRPSWRIIDRWSGLDFDAENFKKRVDELVHFQPNVPTLMEMGVVDIRALTMSIRSGLHAEARLGLDMLARLTYEQQLTLELEKCEDLVEVLVDYGEDLLNLLANDNPEVSDIIDLTPYEDVLHHCYAEVYSLQDPPEFGSKAYDLDRTADRLLAITTIFRNLSFLEINHASLASNPVLKFFSNAIRLVGTRVLLLRSHVNTFDFMKDLITFFSNTSTKIVLPSREDAYTILHFLCAFAPIPRPSEPVKFTPYNPRVHRCLPSAVDSLAKLLARDDPNRTFYKQIFANEATSSPPYELLTRAFGLAIAVVPDRTVGLLHQFGETRIADVRQVEAKLAEIRKPYLMQGMLAADILATMAPGPESGLCRSWLESGDGWATSLLTFSMSLCATDSQFPPPPPPGRGQQRPMEHDVQGFQLIVHRALSVLRRLGEKSRGVEAMVKGAQANGHARHDKRHRHGEHGSGSDSDSDYDSDSDMETVSAGGGSFKVKASVIPKRETLLSALLTPSLDARSLKQFCGIGYLDDML
jgi:SWI/SNF chromatin-remodeling complex subunit SWI1